MTVTFGKDHLWPRAHFPVQLGADIVHVWRFPLSQKSPVGNQHTDRPGRAIEEWWNLLSEEERARADRFVALRARSDFIVAHGMLRELLGACLGTHPCLLAFESSPFGKPRLATDDLRFNLSHAGDIGVVAISSTRELGIDIEPILGVPGAMAIAERYFTLNEQAWLRQAQVMGSLSRAFVEAWTRKEAVLKATGLGLELPLNSFEVTFWPEVKCTLRSLETNVSRWTLHDLPPAAGYCGALAVEGGSGSEPEIRRWTQDTEL